ncbi:MAG: ATP-binding protein [Flavobacteriales bacterium]|jgi:two-component system nitrogen regulation sensor histidine kinase NtrY|tara:strand:- start:318 stop:1763 length:1446 start_codon:yes stop_codon:yes gene_type:complete
MKRLNLKTRIYLSIIAMILVSFFATGIVAYTNFKSRNEVYHSSRLERKEKAIQASMDYFLEQQGEVNTDSIPIMFSDKICELADVHNLDLNLYDLSGKLLISSNPNIFTEKGIPQKVSTSILQKLTDGDVRIVLEKGKDNDEFYLAYWHFSDLEGRPLAVTNIPYFDIQNENRQEIENFLIDLILIYVGLFIAASILALLLSNYITQSLQRIGDKMKGVDLGKTNTPLEWETNDEIGSLVTEYNRMLKEAEKSAIATARSERESAWREMAKQVAHEIKNPLTPMKLRIQYLQRAMDDKDPDWEDKFKNTAVSLINQIDTLTNIANEFSNFAQMPKAKEQNIELSAVIEDAIQIFSLESDVEMTFTTQTEHTNITADKDQILRVFNNLLKNAIQAIPVDRKGEISIYLKEYNGMVKVEIQDNGSGVPEEIQENIFIPNFTTKSKGMGLGLAMVKNIIENHGGEIWFKTKKDEGTTFYLTFKV